jgi:hypothetical protein
MSLNADRDFSRAEFYAQRIASRMSGALWQDAETEKGRLTRAHLSNDATTDLRQLALLMGFELTPVNLSTLPEVTARIVSIADALTGRSAQ